MIDETIDETEENAFVNDAPDEAATSPEVELPKIDYGVVTPLAVVQLSFPFEIDGVQVTTVCFRPPSFSDVEAVMKGSMSELDMHAGMTCLSVDALRALRWPDLELVSVIARHIAPKLKAF